MIIGLEGAHSACAGPLVELLVAECLDVRVCFAAHELFEAPEDAGVILLNAARDAEFLNLARPVVASRRLRVLVWLRPGDRRELRRRARDFLDWMQESVDVPEFVPAYAAQALRRALDGGASISWEGPPLHDLIPDVTVLLPDRVDDEEAIAAMREGPVVIHRPRDLDEVTRFEAMHRAAGRAFGLVWDEPAALPAGAARIIAEPLDWEVASEWLEKAGVDDPRIEAARLSLDPMEISRRAGKEPPSLAGLEPWSGTPTMEVAQSTGSSREQRARSHVSSGGSTGAWRKWWEETMRICDPKGPPEDTALIVRRPVTQPGGVPLANLFHPLASTILVAGAPGSGVSTELRSVSLQLHEQDEPSEQHCVVMFDVWDHFMNGVRDPAAFDRLTPSELAVLLGLAAIRVGHARWGIRWGRALQWLGEAIRELTGKDFDVQRLVSALCGARAPDARMQAVEPWTMPLGMRKDSTLDDPGIRTRRYLETALQLVVNELRVSTGRSVTFIVDGLDRLQQPRHVEELISSRPLPSAALAFAVRSGHLTRARHFDRAWAVVHLVEDIPVIDVQEPAKHASGVEFFRELLERRFASNPYDRPTIPVDVLDRLCWASGGRPGECLLLVRELAKRAYNEAPGRLYELATEVLEDRRKQLAVHVTQEGHALLRSLLRRVVEQLPDDQTADELDALGLLRSYPIAEGSHRVLPHPLLIEGLSQG